MIMENLKQTNYRILFEIKDQPLCIPFGSYNDYTLLGENELKEFIIYLIGRCINAQSFMDNNEKSLFIKNIHLQKTDEDITIFSLVNRSIQIYP